MEICWVHDNKTVIDYDSKVKKFGLNKEDIKNSKLVKFVKEHPEEAFAGALVATIGVAVVADISINGGAAVACGAIFNEID